MFHPFLILPIAGAVTLGKAVYHANNSLTLIVISMLISFIIFGVLYYIYTDVKPPTRLGPVRGHGHRPGHIDVWDAIDDFQLLLRGEERGFDDQANIMFEIHNLLPEVAHPILIPNNRNTDVHDHQIQESLRQSISALTKWYEGINDKISQINTYKQIKEYLFGDYEDQLNTKEKAYSTIRQIEKTNGLLSSVNKREGDILRMVWQRINDPVNETVRNELKNHLIDQLADCAIHLNAQYCLVGRITRMVQTLQSLDQEGLVDIKSAEVLAKEIQVKIPILQKDFFTEHPALLKHYDNGNETVAKELISFVRIKLYEDYPQSNSDMTLKKVIEEHLTELD